MPESPADTTAVVRDVTGTIAAAEVTLLLGIVDWAVAHTLHGADAEGLAFADTGVPLGGEGCPVVSEFAAYELSAVMGRSSGSGAAYIGKTLELRYRLPKLWARVVALEVTVWKAFRIAELTMNLPVEGAAFVDTALAFCAHRCGFAQIERTVEDAIARFDPDEAEARRRKAAEGRKFGVHTEQVSTDGTVEVAGTLDLADALDLEKAVQETAKALGEAGCEESLDVRRAMAVGEIARGQDTLPLTGGTSGSSGRAVTIYVHVDEDSDVATVDNTRSNALIAQVAAWCADAARVTIKPVIDLNATFGSCGYQPSEAVHEQVVLRDGTCIFPSCTRPASTCDLDHRVPFEQGGTTTSDNLAPLCRRHHRAKTHSAWSYTSPEPGLYVWTSPEGHVFTADRRCHAMHRRRRA